MTLTPQAVLYLAFAVYCAAFALFLLGFALGGSDDT